MQHRPGARELSSTQIKWSYSVAVASVKFKEVCAWPYHCSLEPVSTYVANGLRCERSWMQGVPFPLFMLINYGVAHPRPPSQYSLIPHNFSHWLWLWFKEEMYGGRMKGVVSKTWIFYGNYWAINLQNHILKATEDKYRIDRGAFLIALNVNHPWSFLTTHKDCI